MLPTARKLQRLVVLGALLWAGPAVLAQKTTFLPVVELGHGYSDNVGFGGDVTESDSIETLRLILPVSREWRRGRLDFRYQPSISRYNERDELDRDEHKVRLGIRAEPSRDTKYRLALRFRSTQVQGDSESTDDADLFIAGRTDRRIATADFTTEARLSPRWIWELGLGGSLYDYEAIDDFDPNASNSVEDRTETRGAVRFARNLRGSGTNLGVQLAHSDFDLDVSPDATMDSIRLVYNRRIGPKADVSLALGAYQLDSELESQDNTGVDINAVLTRRFRRVLLALNGRTGPSSGGALRGASTNSLLSLSLISSSPSPWSWRISPRLAERDPNDASAGKRRTVSVGGEIGRSIARHLRLRLRANHIDQSNDLSDAQDRATFTADFSLQWFPRGGADSSIR